MRHLIRRVREAGNRSVVDQLDLKPIMPLRDVA